METGIAQRRNAQMRSGLDDSFLRNRTFFEDGARLLSAVKATHRQGGGSLWWGWMADSLELAGEANAANQHLTGVGIQPSDYDATANGGPYADLVGGGAEYFSAGDRTWAEPSGYDFLVWQWANADQLSTTDRIICSKWGAAGNREWHLYWDLGNTAFQFEVSADGTAISGVTSSYAESTGLWYFVAGYYTPSIADSLRIYVGAATDADLTSDTAVAPGLVFAGTASLEIGSENAGTNSWDGKIGIGAMRGTIYPGNFDDINGHISRLFQMTKWFYQ